MFVYNARLTDNITLVDASPTRRVWQMVWYTTHLCTGETICNRAIKSGTINGYLDAASSFIASFTGSDPRYWPGEKSKAKEITTILAEYKRWEKMPDRREPYTIELQRAFDKSIEDKVHNPEFYLTLESALNDWFGVGLSTGQRLSEWAQHNENKGDIHAPLRKGLTNDTIAAFLPEDIQFMFGNKKRCSLQEAVDNLSNDKVKRVTLTWRIQKNNQNGETKTFLRNDKSPRLCVVRRMQRIMLRYITLVGLEQPEVPLGIYRANDGTVRTIISKQIDEKMRSLVTKHYNYNPVTDKKLINKWSSHSLRVGACQILYASGFTCYEIKVLLRWRSDAFMDYLRDIAWVARKRNDALADLDSDVVPVFL